MLNQQVLPVQWPLSASLALKKAAARTAIVNVDDSTLSMLRDCFRQFRIETIPLGADAPDRLQKEKFDACVITLDDRANEILESARNSRSNRRMVVFAICNGVAEAIRYSKYGLNVLLERPVDRQTALKAVRATHLLIVNEFRRYVRIPIVVRVEAQVGMKHLTGSTLEVSGGGMSLRYTGEVQNGDDISVTFDLPHRPGIKVRGIVCWLKPSESLAGIRFDPPEQPGRDLVRAWIDQYLEIE